VDPSGGGGGSPNQTSTGTGSFVDAGRCASGDFDAGESQTPFVEKYRTVRLVHEQTQNKLERNSDLWRGTSSRSSSILSIRSFPPYPSRT
jgi:hypothetical protein